MRKGFLLIFTLFCTSVICQFSDDFEDGEISSSPTWQGDVSQFTVNAEGLLQLLAPAAGKSIIYSPAIFPDSFSFSFTHILDFSPSSSNYSRVYFLLDNLDLTKANGYYFNFGENGSADAIKLYKLENGNAGLIATGTLGAIALNTNFILLTLDYQDKKFTLKSSYNEGGPLSEEFVISHNIFSPTNQTYIALECVYTASRIDKFFFDDINLELYKPDITAPSIIEVVVVDDQTLSVKFSEPVSEATLLPSNFLLSPGSISVASIDKILNSANIIITLSSPITIGQNYKLLSNILEDLKGNKQTNFEFGNIKLNGHPTPGSIYLSEILFNPVVNGFDYLEFYNDSEIDIDLKRLIVKNIDNSDTKTIANTTIIKAKSYVALTSNVQQVLNQYNPPNGANILSFTIPAFNNDKGHVAIYFPEDQLIDEFNYSEDFHNALLDDVEGVSLERLSFTLPFDNGNYASASKSVHYGSPGYANSNGQVAITTNESFTLPSKKFSPDNDGQNDELLINYQLEESGYVLNLAIYDANGQFIKKIASNDLLGRNGILRWDGTDADGNLERTGIYLLIGTAHSLNSRIIKINKTCILAQRL